MFATLERGDLDLIAGTNVTTVFPDVAMHWFDTTLLMLLGLGAALGAWSGFVWQIARFLTLGLSIYGAVLFHEPASQLLQECALQDADARLVRPVAYIGVFVLVYLILLYSSRLLREAVRAAHLDVLDRLFGAALGAGKMALVLGIVCLLMASHKSPASDAILGRSTLAPLLADGMEVVVALIPEDYKTRLAETVQNLRELGKSHLVPRERSDAV